ncbi:hypothetical protein [Methanohalophilus sp.]
MTEELSYVKELNVKMSNKDVALLDQVMQRTGEKESFNGDRSEFIGRLLNKALWELLIKEKRNWDEVCEVVDRPRISFQEYLRQNLGNNYNPVMFLDAPVIADEGLSIDDVESFDILMPANDPNFVEIRKMQDLLLSGNSDSFQEEASST